VLNNANSLEAAESRTGGAGANCMGRGRAGAEGGTRAVTDAWLWRGAGLGTWFGSRSALRALADERSVSFSAVTRR
jgi:hypothetical protein